MTEQSDLDKAWREGMTEQSELNRVIRLQTRNREKNALVEASERLISELRRSGMDHGDIWDDVAAVEQAIERYRLAE